MYGTTSTKEFTIERDTTDFWRERYLIRNAYGDPLTDKYGNIRYFKTRNSASKRISREKSGNFHR